MFSSADDDCARCILITAFLLQFVAFESALTSLWTCSLYVEILYCCLTSMSIWLSDLVYNMSLLQHRLMRLADTHGESYHLIQLVPLV